MTNPVTAPVDARVAVVRWPSDDAARVRARAIGTPRLLLIDAGTAPPVDCDVDEDWTSTAAPPGDVAARLAALATRPSRPHRLPIDVACDLDDASIAVYDALAARAPRPATMASLRRAIGPAGDLATTLRRVRRALRPIDADVVTVAGGALLVDLSAGGR